MSELALYIGNDNVIELRGLTNSQTGAFINDGAVGATVKNKAGDELSSPALSYVAGTNGMYQGIVEDSVVLVDGEFYEVTIVAVGDSLNGAWTQWVEAKVRKFL